MVVVVLLLLCVCVCVRELFFFFLFLSFFLSFHFPFPVLSFSFSFSISISISFFLGLSCFYYPSALLLKTRENGERIKIHQTTTLFLQIIPLSCIDALTLATTAGRNSFTPAVIASTLKWSDFPRDATRDAIMLHICVVDELISPK